MIRLRFLLLALVVCGSNAAHAFEVKGVVTGADGPLPYAAVYERGTAYGVVTNVRGQYFIELTAGTHTLVFETMGYIPVSKTFEVTGNMTLNVVLQQGEEVLQTVVVDKNREDPAYRVIRKAIEQKELINRSLKSYTCNMYIKASLEVEDTDRPDTADIQLTGRKRVNMIESFSKIYFVKPDKFKEEKIGFRDLAEKANQTESVSVAISAGGGGNRNSNVQSIEIVNPKLFFTRLNDASFDFTQNLMYVPSLSQKPFVSPIANQALSNYTYRLLESFNREGQLLYKISVTPKNFAVNGFTGVLYILDSSFVIDALELSLNAVNLPFFDHFSIIQNYIIHPDGSYLLSRQEFYYDDERKLEKMVDFGQTVVHFDGYEINLDIPDKFMRSGAIVYDKKSYDRPDSFWTGVRPITLKSMEAEFIRLQDSAMQYQKSAEYLDQQDSVFNDIGVWDILLTGIGHRNRNKGLTLMGYSLLQQVKLNLVDGYRHTLGGSIEKEWDGGNEMILTGGISYGFLNQNIRGDIETRFKYDPFRFGYVRFRYSHIYTMINLNESIRGTFSPSNYADNVGYGIGHEMEWFNGFFLKAYADYNLFRAYDGKILEGVWRNMPMFSEPKDFAPFEELVITLSARLTFAQEYEIRPTRKVIMGSKYPIVNIQYQKGIKPWLGSDVNYDRIIIDAEKDLRIGSVGLSRFKLLAGRFLNAREVRISSLKYFRGSDPYYFSNPLNTYQLIGPLSLTTSKTYLQAHYVHHFNGAVLGNMSFFNRHSIQLAVGGSALYLEENNLRHLEVYTGLEKPFTLQKQLFRFGIYYVNAVSSGLGFSHGLKLGFDFYNGYNHQWQY